MSLSAAQEPPVKAADYDFIFRNYRSFLCGVVYHSGVPHYSVEDASLEIFVRMLAQHGLEQFDGCLADNASRTKAYLASYFSLGARAERSRIHRRESRSVTLAALPDLDNLPAIEPADCDLLEALLTVLTGDARHFIETAADHPTYAKARTALVAQGWDTLRIRRAVKEARSMAREYLCTHR